MKKLWAGRFKEETSRLVEKYTESISFDRMLYRYDIEGSIAHAKMLARQGIISKRDAEEIIKGLNEIYREIDDGRFEFKEELEDIHMNIESALIEKAGEAGSRLHTARSRNDQVSLSLRLYLKAEIKEIVLLLKNLGLLLAEMSERNLDVIMPGYTHMQRAQPLLLSHHLMAYAHMFDRDRRRFEDALKRIDVLPLGSCALAGTSLPIDRHYVAECLGFDHVSENSMDSVSDRDFAVEFLSCAAIFMMHVSRMAEELILWSSEEFSFIELPDALTTGSSIMPQKRNPDVAELMRGKTGRIYGNLISLLTIMKGLPLAYNRDMQEDKEPVFDTVTTIKPTLNLLIEMLSNMRFNKKRLRDTASSAYSTATDIAEYLVRKGVPFRTAHEITGRIVRYFSENKKRLSDISVSEYKSFSDKIDDDIYNFIGDLESVNAKRSYGGTSPEMVKGQIKRFREGMGTEAKP
ncbi:argininosuccinate lyase [Thermodesulfovibrionales bacterium]|nr:argininosuccinate lyase [Thermodesulfovibrionales bacterium]MCL0030236.1 argininosuccinate lyase [Thermodesulfovibrionales bacterium]MCL0083054.1 argininosuccinate lyase [Thermodesulfovibrionales bacterium]MCL0084940.1 argininosuccinate lyase [Thermodesulfovibrionales bacterium]MCL0096487.1 argininosuccinate lyase [Thermodesulfovibrionales bacterium]